MSAKKYVKSQYLRAQSAPDDQIILHHSLFGSPIVTNSDALEMLDFFTTSHSYSELRSSYSVPRKTFNQFLELHYLVEEGQDERQIFREKLEQRRPLVETGALVKHLRFFTADCNFACGYCSVSHIDQLGCQPMVESQARMGWKTAKLAVDQLFLLARQHGHQKVRIRFFGGEPMRDWLVYRRVIEYAANQTDEPKVEFYLNTNGSIMTPAIAEFLKLHKVKTIISLDGIGEVNDRFRTYKKSGRGTFFQGQKTLLLLKQVGVTLHINITLHRANINHLLEVVDLAKTLGAVDVGLEDLCFIEGTETKFNTNKRIEAEKVLEAWRYGQKIDMPVLGSWSGFRDSPQFHGSLHYCAGNGEEICVDHNGSVFTCFGLPVSIGQISDLRSCFRHPMYQAMALRLVNNIPACQGCEIEGPCGGNCAADVFALKQDINAVDDNKCEFRRTISRQLLLEWAKS